MYQASGASDLCREDFVLLYAGSEKEAREKAAQRGRQEETSHRNAEGDIVTWSLIHIVDVNEVLDEDLTQDADLYSRHFRNREAYEAFEPLLSGEEL